MEDVAISKRQALEMAKGIVEASDAELAFLLQLQEIVKSTESASPEDPEAQDTETEADRDKGVALALAVEDLGALVSETEETQLSLLEAERLARLDAILVHDAQFAQSIQAMPSEEWEEIGDEMEEPFDVVEGPNEILIYNEADEQLESVLRQLEETASTFTRKRSHANMENNRHGIRRGNVPETELQGKGKTTLQEDDDDDDDDDDCLPGSGSSLRKKRRVRFALDSLEHKGGETSDCLGDGDCDQSVCQICFDAKLDTSPFVSLEGCGHIFCETCVSRHAEVKILDGQAHIACPQVDCQTIISFTELSYLLNPKMLEILSRRQVEAAIPDSERLYCPFKDCSALLCKPSGGHVHRPSSSRQGAPPAFGCVECDACHRSLCLECEVVWHADMSCAEYKANLKNLSQKGDEKLLQLADKQKWQRCKCGRVVELTFGCFHMSCICGHGFCYICGAPWLSKNSKTCSCPIWSESNL